MSTKKISELTEAIASEITPGTDVIIINDGDTSNISKVRFIFKIKLEYIK